MDAATPGTVAPDGSTGVSADPHDSNNPPACPCWRVGLIPRRWSGRLAEFRRSGQQSQAAQGRNVFAATVAARLNGTVVPHIGRTGTPAPVAVEVVDVPVAEIDQPIAVLHRDDGVIDAVDAEDTALATDPTRAPVDRRFEATRRL